MATPDQARRRTNGDGQHLRGAHLRGAGELYPDVVAGSALLRNEHDKRQAGALGAQIRHVERRLPGDILGFDAHDAVNRLSAASIVRIVALAGAAVL